MYDHFKADNNADGSVKDVLPSSENPLSVNNNGHSNNCNGNGCAVLNLGMVKLSSDLSSCSSLFFNSSEQLGSRVDDDAPYSPIGVPELLVLCSSLGLSPTTRYDPTSSVILHYDIWQYGSGEHSSVPRWILGSFLLAWMSDSRRLISICPLVIEGSSQWLIGQTVTSHCNQLRIDDNWIQIPKFSAIHDY